MRDLYVTALFIIASFFILPARAQLISNGDFENDFADWTNLAGDGGVATYAIETGNVYEGTKAFSVDVQTLGTNSWSIQSINSTWTAVQGETYTLTFYARTDNPGTQLRAVQQNTSYAANDFTLTTNWQQYTWVFNAQEEFLQLKFHFIQLGVVYIDDIQITGQSAGGNSPTDTTTIDVAVEHQYIEGFGAALAFYEGWVTAHPNKEQMYQLVFEGLGLDWLRIRNDYRYQGTFAPDAIEFVQKADQYRGDSIRTLMCSWSPPANLKSNNNLNNGTLAQQGGEFVYGAFADYWRDALIAYDNVGVNPDWISIQNEPDWLTDAWETCEFTPQETGTTPGYDQAFDSVYQRIQGLPNVPEMIGAEPLGIGYNNFDNYNQHIQNKSQLFGYAYHLYHGGDPDLPDSYNATLNFIKNNYSDHPNIMTEYEHFDAGWLKTAWLVSNVLTEANASAYFYWDLIWPDNGLIDMDNPWDMGAWENGNGYELNPHYFAFKHFSRYIHSGYTRIGCVSNNNALRSSAYVNPAGDAITLVYVNTGTMDITSTVDVAGAAISSSIIIQSVDGNYDQNLGSLVDNEVDLPGESVTTIVLGLTTPVPVELLNFSAIKKGNDVQLEWATASESNNDYFVVERSDNGVQFEEVARVEGEGNSNQMTGYTAIDQEVPAGTWYYRLKQVDIDGKFSYSGTVSIDIEKMQVAVYPNPFDDVITFNLQGETKTFTYALFNITGEQVLSGVGESGNIVQIQKDVPEGIYLLQLICGQDVYRKKIIRVIR